MLRTQNNVARISHIILYVNNKCNMHCPYCLDSRKRTGKEFDLSLIPYLVDMCKKLKEETKTLETRIMFLGGEPSLSPRVLDTIMSSVPKYYKFEIMTNAYRWSKYFLDVIHKHKERIIMIPSYDGLFQEQRKKGSSEIVRKNIQYLINNGFRTLITTVMDKAQSGMAYENVKFLLNFHNLLFVKRQCEHAILGNDDKYVSMFDKDMGKIVDLCTFRKVHDGCVVSLPNRIENGNTIYCLNRRGTFSCHDYCINEIIMDTDGTIYPCECYITDYKHPIGHLKTGYDVSEFIGEYNKKFYHSACPYYNEKINGNPKDCSGVLNDAVDKILLEARDKYEKMETCFCNLRREYGHNMYNE